MMSNKSHKPTVTRVTPFAEQAKPAPRYGGLVPPLRVLNGLFVLRIQESMYLKYYVSYIR